MRYGVPTRKGHMIHSPRHARPDARRPFDAAFVWDSFALCTVMLACPLAAIISLALGGGRALTGALLAAGVVVSGVQAARTLREVRHAHADDTRARTH